LLDIEKYEDTFGPKASRRKVKLNNMDLEGMMDTIDQQETTYKHEKDGDLLINKNEYIEKNEHRDRRMEAGQSKRIWVELHKVIDSSDVIV